MRGRPRKNPIEIDPNLGNKPLPESLARTEIKPYVRLCDWYEMITGGDLDEAQRDAVKLLCAKYSEEEVMSAMEIALDRYYYGSRREADYALTKAALICYFRRKMNDEG